MAFDISNLSSTPAEYASPNQLAAIREYSKYLLEGKGQQPVNHPLQGVSNIVSALMGGSILHDAGQSEKASKMYEAEGSLPQAPGQMPRAGGLTPVTPSKPVPAVKRAFSGTPEEAIAGLTMPPGEVASSGTGSAFGGLPGWASDEKPVGWSEGDYDSRVPNSKRMALSAEPGIQAITEALQPKGPQVAQASGGVVQPGNYLPPNVTPSRPVYTREQALRVLGGFHLPQTERDSVRGGYLTQNQPIPVPVAGGNILVPGSGQGQQSYIPDLKNLDVEAGDVKLKNMPAVINPDLSFRYLQPQGALPGGIGGAIPSPAPPAGVGALPFAAEAGDGGAPFPGAPPPVKMAQGPNPLPTMIPPMVGDLQKWSQENAIEKARREKLNQMHLDVEKKRLESPIEIENKKLEELNKTQIDAGEKDFSKIRDIAEVAYRELPTFEMAKRVIEDPAFVSGFGNQPILTIKRALNQMGFTGKMSDPYAMELFQKLTASVNLDNLKTLLGGLGQIRVFEGDLVKNATANIANTPAANRVLLNIGMKANQRAIERADLAADYRKEHGFLDSGWGKFERNHFKDKPWLSTDEIANFRQQLEADPRYKPVQRNGEPITPASRPGRYAPAPVNIPRAPTPQQFDVPPPPG